jgi:putative ABC transport system permease protein
MYWAIKKQFNRQIMNTLKIFEKTFFKHKLTNLMSIGGLSLGIAVSILLGWWAINELRFDRFHSDAHKTYRICREGFINNETIRIGTVNNPLALAVREQLPQVEDLVRIGPLGKERFQVEDVVNYEEAMILADSNFFQFFSFPLKQGAVESCLDDPDEMVVSEAFAAKYFGDEDPVGRTVEFMDRSWRISAVMYNVPANSHLQFETVGAITGLQQYNEAPWGWDMFNVYVKTNENTSLDELGSQITDIAVAGFPAYKEIDLHHFLQPMTGIHFDTSHFRFDNVKTGDRRFVMIFSFMALAILIIACINFTNLFISTAFLRLKSIGLKKANGAGKSTLIREFYLETGLYVLISLALGQMLAKLALPVFNTLANTRMELNFGEPILLAYMAGITLFSILMAGTFPALYLTRFRPAATLKGEVEEKNVAVMQKALVVLQFAASIVLLISVFTIRRQVHFFQTADLGFNNSDLICVDATGAFSESYDMIKAELERQPGIVAVTAKNSLPLQWRHGDAISASTEDEPFIVEICDIKENYMDVLEIGLVDGEPFTDHNDSLRYIWVNEQAARLLGYENPVGEVLHHRSGDFTIKGVVNDIKSKSLHNPVDPQVYIKLTQMDERNVLMIKMAGDARPGIAAVEEKWNEVNPGYPFEYQFLDQAYDELYQEETRAGQIVTWGMLIAMFITIMGLFAMARYTTERRTKEIGVRRVNGAELSDILVMLNKDFLKYVVLSCVLALPLGWYIMKGWLESFAYRTTLSWWIMLVSASAALLTAMITVSWQSYAAARQNPVESLRYE